MNMQSHPTRVRGLKQYPFPVVGVEDWRRTPRGAWIETTVSR